MNVAFKSKTTTQKGIAGEDIVFSWLRARGHTIYRPNDDDKRHPIDALIMHREKLLIVAADIKTKPRRLHYPDTGINISHYGEYCYIKNINKIRVYLFFVDEHLNKIYGNYLDKLEERREILHNGERLIYPRRECGIIYFSLEAMLHIGNLPDGEANKLKEMNGSKYSYTHDEQQRSLNLVSVIDGNAAESNPKLQSSVPLLDARVGARR